ncbi:MAG: hypothetical protein LBU44_04600 [Mediterranea sp.]|jgi:hypothetical protein|nr:hypothetical protein [Mediterranea sp.]
MAKKLIRSFSFQDLNLSDHFEFSHAIFEYALPPALAQSLGLFRPYNDAKDSYDKEVVILKCNPAMLKTEELAEVVTKARRKMILLKDLIRDKQADATGEDLRKTRRLRNVTLPYLKELSHDTQTTIAANGIEVTDVLCAPSNLPLLIQFGLKEVVDDIAALAHEAGKILHERGEEKAFKKAMDNAIKIRRLLERQFRFLFYTAIPVHYLDVTGALAETFKQAIMDINGTLDSFRHLTDSDSSDWGGNDNPENNEDNGNEEG